MYCSKCGNKVGDNNQFCEVCGNKVGSSKNIDQQSQMPNGDKVSPKNLNYKLYGVLVSIITSPLMIFLVQTNLTSWYGRGTNDWCEGTHYELAGGKMVGFVFLFILLIVIDSIIFHYDKVQNNKEKVDKIFVKLLSLNLIVMFLYILILSGMGCTVA